MLKKLFKCVLSAAMVIGLVNVPVHAETTDPNTATGTQKPYVIGDDWGPGVSKTVLTLDKEIDPDSVSKDTFNVLENKNAIGMNDQGEFVYDPVEAPRTVLDAYTSNETGDKVDVASKNVTIEMYVSPTEGNPFVYNIAAGANNWCETYELKVAFNEGQKMTSNGTDITAINVKADIDLTDRTAMICPEAEVFDSSKTYTAKADGITYHYADYVPALDNGKNPLVIWLHGAGEGGTDPYIDLLGNEVTNFAQSEFQNIFDGAYVLAPQSPTMWMEGPDGEMQMGDKGSKYEKGLFELIETYVKSNPDIDPTRVIVGGCSNGGYMTMELILKHPDFFAAAYPICEAYADEFITDEQIKTIKDMAIWFVYATTDPVVPPVAFAIPTAQRLRDAGATNIHESAFEKIVDPRFNKAGLPIQDGEDPYEYNGHFSWVYFDNNMCEDETGNAWNWLSEQTNSNVPSEILEVVNGEQTITIEGFEWGPGVVRTTVKLDEEITGVNTGNINVKEIKSGIFNIEEMNRTVTRAYLSDANGNPVKDHSDYITIDMAVSPTEGNPFRFDLDTFLNDWCKVYDLVITNTTPVYNKYGEEVQLTINPTPVNKIKEDADKFAKKSFTASDGTELGYGFYTPETTTDELRPLIVWLHGAGEGGTDNDIIAYGNEVTGLIDTQIQSYFKDGAYVLTPQCPTMWMNDGEGYTKDGTSIYTESLMELIDAFVKDHPEIDPNRIYLGGCSNGGFMTMNMIIHYPEYFAAAYPICEAYDDSWITDEQIEAIKDMPIWFTHALTDTTVDPYKTSIATYDRLVAAGAKDVHKSIFDNVIDTSGKYFDENGNPYEYAGHWSWIYVFNDEVEENGVSLFEWLASHTNATETEEVPTTPDTPTTGDNTMILGIASAMALSCAGYFYFKKKEQLN